MPPRVINPLLEDLPNLRQPLTEGENVVLNYFIEHLPSEWEIYIQPHLNGLRPDFVLLHPKRGIAVYEVKDWDLSAMEYLIKIRGDGAPILMGSRDGKQFSLEKQNPVTKIDVYKEDIYNLYCPRLQTNTGLGAIIAGIIFTFALTEHVSELLAPLRKHYGHDQYPRLYPIIGRDILKSQKSWTLERSVLSCANKIDDRMSEERAADLRNWLVEPEFARDQRTPLIDLLTLKQRDVVLNKDNAAFRRIRGSAGSGKSFVLAGRAAQLAKDGKRVLVITFNITLINYLLDLAVRFAKNGKIRKQIVAYNFHYWCKRVALMTGHYSDYHALWKGARSQKVLQETLAEAVTKWLDDLDENRRWDAILLDEGQDFELSWWLALRKALIQEGKGEALLCADRVQNIYGITPWTEDKMTGAGFRGQWMALDECFRMPPSLCKLAETYINDFLPDAEHIRPIPPKNYEFDYYSSLKWWHVSDENIVAQACFDAIIDIIKTSNPPISYADLVCVVENADIGLSVVKLLNDKGINSIHTFGRGDNKIEINKDSRRKKLAFFQGDGRVKLTTLHSFKGWETKALIVQISRASSDSTLSLAYAGITRLKQNDRGSYLTVINTTPNLKEYGKKWPVYLEYNPLDFA
jgi:hypothetical protein